jgi:glycosyltransferase involved in cell wall biosynthesis
MRILIVNNLYPPHSRGGAETAVVNEALSLAAAGHDVSVLTTAPFLGLRSLKASEWNEDGVRVFRFFPLNLFWYRNDHRHGAFLRALWYIGNLWGWHPISVFKKVVKIAQPDVVHLHNINGISYRLPKVCDKLKLKTVFTAHAVHYAYPSGVILRGQKAPASFRIFKAILRRKLRSTAIVTAPSRWLLEYYQDRGFFRGQKTVVIQNPLLMPASGRGIARGPVSKKKTDGHKPLATCQFLFVGQLEPYKGLNVMLAALKSLPPALPWRLTIVGDGPMMDALRRERDSRVLLRGRLAPDDVALAMASAHAFIMPSLCEENAPMVIAEAHAMGLPVIASRIGGIPEMVEDGLTGMLFEPGQVEDLSTQCRRAIERPEILAGMRDRCRQSAERYAPERVAGEYLKLFGG